MPTENRPTPRATEPGCTRPSIEAPAGIVLMPAAWTDPETGTKVPADERCNDCGDLFGHHRHLACCVEICGRCGEERTRCVCPVA